MLKEKVISAIDERLAEKQDTNEYDDDYDGFTHSNVGDLLNEVMDSIIEEYGSSATNSQINAIVFDLV
jgi:hypothetical protein